jgi:hypothetical protein
MISPLLFSVAGDHSGKLLPVTPQELFPFTTHFEKLRGKGVKSAVWQHASIAHSPYSTAMLKGAEVVPFQNWVGALESICARVQQPSEGPTYLLCYFGDIDSVGHRQGIYSDAFEAAVDNCFTLLEEKLLPCIRGAGRKLALILTADHGMTPVRPQETVWLNQLCPELASAVQVNRAGQPMVPAGSGRDFFLHIQPEKLSYLHGRLSELLQPIARVVLTAELLAAGFFGSKPPAERLLARIGNLVVLPYLGSSVFWKFSGHHLEQHFHAAHGGLTPEEMHSVLLFWGNTE